jgi:hypothetical protein
MENSLHSFCTGMSTAMTMKQYGRNPWVYKYKLSCHRKTTNTCTIIVKHSVVSYLSTCNKCMLKRQINDTLIIEEGR